MNAWGDKKFPWGEVVKIHTINGVDIVEYISEEDKQTWFKPYVGTKDPYTSYPTLDVALICGISFKYLKKGNEAQEATRFVCRMLLIK